MSPEPSDEAEYLSHSTGTRLLAAHRLKIPIAEENYVYIAS